MSINETGDMAVRAKRNALASIREHGMDPLSLAQSTAGTMAQSLGGGPASGPDLLVVGIHVVVGTIHGVSEAGVSVGEAAESIMSGVLRGAGRTGRPTLETVNMLANTMVRTSAGVGGDPVATAVGIVEGARACALELALPIDAAAGAAAAGVLRAAAEMNPLLAGRIRAAIDAADGHEALRGKATSAR